MPRRTSIRVIPRQNPPDVLRVASLHVGKVLRIPAKP